jgi:hypothetical protein
MALRGWWCAAVPRLGAQLDSSPQQRPLPAHEPLYGRGEQIVVLESPYGGHRDHDLLFWTGRLLWGSRAKGVAATHTTRPGSRQVRPGTR